MPFKPLYMSVALMVRDLLFPLLNRVLMGSVLSGGNALRQREERLKGALLPVLWSVVLAYMRRPEQWMLNDGSVFPVIRLFTTGDCDTERCELLLDEASQHGLVDVLTWSRSTQPQLWIPNHPNWNQFVQRAAMCETSASLQWFYESGIRSMFTSNLITTAIESRRTTNVVWLKLHNVDWPPDTLLNMIRYDCLDLFQWAASASRGSIRINVGLLHSNQLWLCYAAARYASAGLWNWLDAKFNLHLHVNARIFRILCHAGNVQVLASIQNHPQIRRETWWTRSGEWSFSANLFVVGTVTTIEWLMLNGAKRPTTSAAIEHYATRGRLDLIQYARNLPIQPQNPEQTLPINLNPLHFTTAAATNNHDDDDDKKSNVAENHEPWPWSEEVCRVAARRGDEAMLNWARKNGCPSPPYAELVALAAAHKFTISSLA